MNRAVKTILVVSALVLVSILAWLFVSENGVDTNHADAIDDPQSLYAAAQAEGVVNIWASNAEDLNWIPSAFGAAYPGIKVEVYTDLNIAARVINEARGGLHNVDVIWHSEGLLRPLIERDMLISGEWVNLGVNGENIGADGRMAITSSVAYAVAYRTDRIASADVPSTWTELVDAKFRGKMAASPFLFARLSAGLGAFEGKEPWVEFARRFYNESQTLWTNDLLEQVILSGERPYVVAMANHFAERWAGRGPVALVLPEPVFITQFGSVVMRRAPHPNAARLLAVWLASPEGRAAREKTILAVDLRPVSDHPKAIALRASNKRLYLDTMETTDRRNEIIPEIDRILSGL